VGGLIAAVFFAIVITAAPSRAAGDPMAVVKTVVNQALSVLRNNQLTLKQKQETLRNLVANNFDFAEMSRSALGIHWRSLSSDQRTDFTNVFTTFIEDSYLSKISDYRGQTVNFTGRNQLSPGFAQVSTNVTSPNGGRPIILNYSLKQEGDQWKIYDVTVDAISIVANYRNQFNRVINDRGFPTLLADLRAKSQQLADSLGQPRSGS
jgi:phospholipid transport system substrate-binding protein